MLKFCVQYNLRLETPAKRDTLVNEVKTFIGLKRTWGETTIISGTDREGYPNFGLEIRFDVKDNMDNLFALIKDRMERIPVLKGSVSKHICWHDESPAKPCVILEEYRKE